VSGLVTNTESGNKLSNVNDVFTKGANKSTSQLGRSKSFLQEKNNKRITKKLILELLFIDVKVSFFIILNIQIV